MTDYNEEFKPRTLENFLPAPKLVERWGELLQQIRDEPSTQGRERQFLFADGWLCALVDSGLLNDVSRFELRELLIYARSELKQKEMSNSLELGGVTPTIGSSNWIAPSAEIIGKVELAENAQVWFGAIIRGSSETVKIGKHSRVADHAVLFADDKYPLLLGEHVFVGPHAVLAGCVIGDNSIVGSRAVVRENVTIGRNCTVTDGSVVIEGTLCPDYSKIHGNPATVTRKVIKWKVKNELEEMVYDTGVSESDAQTMLQLMSNLTEAEQGEFYDALLLDPGLTSFLLSHLLKKAKAACGTTEEWASAVEQEIESLEGYLASTNKLGDFISRETLSKLRNYYLENPSISYSAVMLLREAESLLHTEHYGAAHVFAASASEVLIKSVLLRPLVHCSIGYLAESVSDLITDSALSQTGYLRYQSLLSNLFKSIVQQDLMKITRVLNGPALLKEMIEAQTKRNKLVHQGISISRVDAEASVAVSREVYRQIVCAILACLGLQITERGAAIRKFENKTIGRVETGTAANGSAD